MKNILFIHQSAEMYGSDKTLLSLVINLNKQEFYSIVILPNSGPLKTELENHNIKVIIAPVLKLYRKMFTPLNLIKFIGHFFKGLKIIKNINKTHQIDIVYSNTLAVLLGFFYAFFSNKKHIWHVHEIIESPKIFTKLFKFLLNRKTNTFSIHNSLATRNFWNCKQKNQVVWNGIEQFEEIQSIEKQQLRKNIFNTENEIIFALVGRISRWKGQLFLLECFKELTLNNQNIKLVFIGSAPPNQNHFLETLQTKIIELELQHFVEIIPFQDNINQLWQCIDIAVVPSTEPEPFGMVAIEAMMAKKPVIAANHGGLTEIVVDQKTGILVSPNNAEALILALEKLIINSELRNTFGVNGFERAKQEYSVASYINKIENIFNSI